MVSAPTNKSLIRKHGKRNKFPHKGKKKKRYTIGTKVHREVVKLKKIDGYQDLQRRQMEKKF